MGPGSACSIACSVRAWRSSSVYIDTSAGWARDIYGLLVHVEAAAPDNVTGEEKRGRVWDPPLREGEEEK